MYPKILLRASCVTHFLMRNTTVTHFVVRGTSLRIKKCVTPVTRLLCLIVTHLNKRRNCNLGDSKNPVCKVLLETLVIGCKDLQASFAKRRSRSQCNCSLGAVADVFQVTSRRLTQENNVLS